MNSKLYQNCLHYGGQQEIEPHDALIFLRERMIQL